MFLVRSLLIVALCWASSALAGPILQIENNKLVGVKDVVVGLHQFDVSFKKGTCGDLFNSCSSFPFKLLDDNTHRYTNFLDALHVLHKVIYGSDDINAEPPSAFYVPELKIPTHKWHDIEDENLLYVSYARFLNTSGYGEYSVEFNFVDCEDLWTVWSNPRRVPEPSSLGLFGIIFLGLVLVRRLKKS